MIFRPLPANGVCPRPSLTKEVVSFLLLYFLRDNSTPIKNFSPPFFLPFFQEVLKRFSVPQLLQCWALDPILAYFACIDLLGAQNFL